MQCQGGNFTVVIDKNKAVALNGPFFDSAGRNGWFILGGALLPKGARQ
jgi:hypothetical protein